MPITIKTPEEIEKMRIAGRLAAEVLEFIAPEVRAGISTDQLDKLCHDYIVNEQKAIPAPLNYRGFPKSICTSLNHVICHGIPGSKRLKNGDIINIDITVIKDGYHGDTSQMFLVGEVKPYAQQLVNVTQQALYAGIRQVRAGNRISQIGLAIQEYVKPYNYTIVREFCGHGIGKVFHEDPQVLHYFESKYDAVMEAGMTFTIEPMINQGTRHMKMLADGWTAVTRDHKLSAQWEHTLLVTHEGCEILTLRNGESLDPGE